MTSREARIQKARDLIRNGVLDSGGVWADLGCGDGVFTSALYELLGPDLEIYAVDRDQRKLKSLERYFSQKYPDAQLNMVKADFVSGLDLPPLDGIVMANALHFVKQKEPVLARIISMLKPGGRLIIVEYNTNRGNTWVPYPFDEDEFLRLAESVGLQKTRILAKAPSTFLGEFYAGLGARA